MTYRLIDCPPTNRAGNQPIRGQSDLYFPRPGASRRTKIPAQIRPCEEGDHPRWMWCDYSNVEQASLVSVSLALAEVDNLSVRPEVKPSDVQFGNTTVNWKQRTLRFLAPHCGD